MELFQEQSESISSVDNPYKMTATILQDRVDVVEKGRFHSQMYAAITACVSSICLGTVLGWSAPTVAELSQKLRDEPNVTLSNFALVTSLAPLGCSIGVVVFAYFLGKIGPRRTMLIQAPFLLTTWIALALVKQLELELAGRFFTGFFSSAYITCGETLLEDCVHPANLRYMFIMFRASTYIGVTVGCFIGFLLSSRYFSIISASIVFAHALLLLACKESPVHMYEKSPLMAENCLTWYRGNANTVLLMRTVKKTSDLRKAETDTYMLYSKVVLKGIGIVVGLNMFRVFTGYDLFLFYNIRFLKLSTETVTTNTNIVVSPFVDGLILDLTFLVSKALSLWYGYTIPFGVRRPLILSGALVMASLIVVSVYISVKKYFPEEMVDQDWILLIAGMGVIVAYEIGLGYYPDAILYHYLPYQVYNTAKLVVNCIYWALTFLFVQFFMQVQELMGHAEILLFLLVACCIGGIVFTYFFVIEFGGLTLVQIQLKLGGNPVGNRRTII